MPDLNIQVEGVMAVPFAAAPQLAFKLHITNTPADVPIQAVALRCQIQIETQRRRYVAADHALLLDLFGEPERWSKTLRSMLWTIANIGVPPFTGSTLVDLLVPCTYDFNVAATKYFHVLTEGEVPITLLFSGTVFYESADGDLQVEQIPWETEATFRLPVRVWQEMMDLYYPNSTWLRLHRDTFDRLYRYKIQQSLPTWEQALERLLDGADPD